MDNNIEYKEGRIYTMLNHIMWFVLANLYFLATNILLVLYIINFGVDIASNTSILFLVSLVPLGPSFAALCASMGKVIREKDISITSYYFKSYKTNFMQSLKLWLIQLVVFVVSYIDIRFMLAKNNSLAFLFLFIIIATLAIGTFLFPIISRFEFKTIDVVKLAFIYSIKKINVTIMNLIIIFGVFYLLYVIPGLLFLLLSSVACYLIMFNNKDILIEIEDEIISRQELMIDKNN